MVAIYTGNGKPTFSASKGDLYTDEANDKCVYVSTPKGWVAAHEYLVTGVDNVALGSAAKHNTTGSDNVAFGSAAKQNSFQPLWPWFPLFLLALALIFIVSTQAKAQTTVVLTEAELNTQLKLNSAACKAAGLDDGGQACAAGQALNAKLIEAHKASKPTPTAPSQ